MYVRIREIRSDNPDIALIFIMDAGHAPCIPVFQSATPSLTHIAPYHQQNKAPNTLENLF